MYKIYKIIDNTNGNVYIGRTIKKYLYQRLSEHKSHNTTCMSREIIKNGDYKIELIEETDDKTRERYWIENTDCINMMFPGRTKKEYYETNREKIHEQQKEYYEDNKEKIYEQQKEYREKNKEKYLQYKKEYKKYINSMGGDPRYNNNLLKIDVNLLTN